MSVRVLHGDCLELLPTLSGLDACICDPPYHLTSIVKRFGSENAAPAQFGTDGAFARASSGFMGKQWDGGDIALRPETWRLVLNTLKPGAHLVAFGGTRTFHRMACAIEDAGFEIRDCLMWLYGQGFPKSHNIGNGWGTALKPAWEPIILARKPLVGTVAANVLAHGTGAINIDACRIAAPGEVISNHSETGKSEPTSFSLGARVAIQTAGQALGRWPANVLHDGSDEVEAAFAAFGEKPTSKPGGRGVAALGRMNDDGWQPKPRDLPAYGDTGTASRFFYCAKASKADRAGSKHPTVKPQALVRWLCRLVTPPGGTILDCFAGSGSTGAAAMREGFNAVLIEREAEYVADIHKRIEQVEAEATTIITTAQMDMFA